MRFYDVWRRFKTILTSFSFSVFLSIYSCFEKGCLPKGEQLTRQCRKLLWVLWWFLRLLEWTWRCFSMGKLNSTNTYSLFLVPCCWIPLNVNQAKLNSSSHNANRHSPVRFYTFVGQPLSKQLYNSSDHVYLRHLSSVGRYYRPIWRPTLGRYIDRHSADMSAETRSSVGRHEPTSMSADTQPILHRHSAATRPILYQHSANTTLTWSALVTEFYLLCSTERGFQWPSSFFGLKLRQYSCLFSSYVFSSSSLLYTTLVTFGCSSIWGLLLSEARYFRGAKDDIKSWYDCALFLPRGWVFQF